MFVILFIILTDKSRTKEDADGLQFIFNQNEFEGTWTLLVSRFPCHHWLWHCWTAVANPSLCTNPCTSQRKTETRKQVSSTAKEQSSIESRRLQSFWKLPNDKCMNVYPITTILENGNRRTCYPFIPSYAVTICKAQRQTLNSAIVWFDIPRIPAGSAYVALARVKKSADLLLMTALLTSQFTPVVGIHWPVIIFKQ